MNCPKCDDTVLVIDTVNLPSNEIYRKRKCSECGHIFYTAEFEVEHNQDFIDEWNANHRDTQSTRKNMGRNKWNAYQRKRRKVRKTKEEKV